MVEIGKFYRSESGERFLILAIKSRPSSNGYDYIGENVKTGVIAFFNHKGEHSFVEELNLQCDPYTWIAIESGNELDRLQFVTKEELTLDPETTYVGLLRMQDNHPQTITFVSVRDYHKTYA